nr:MAG: ORF1 [TTV-like mini virus]
MPWGRNYWTRRRRWFRRWRSRNPFRRKRFYRRRRTRWVRKKKLKTLLLKEFQPNCIHKCKIKGIMPIFWGPAERFINNYDSYELTAAPPQLPSGGLFSIKNISLESLFSENRYVRNVWTKTNQHLPMCRYTGCKIKFWASERIDLIATYDTALPLRSDLLMYHTMHPGVHIYLPHRKIIPKKHSTTRTKPYHTVKIKPPKPLTNKWYFQAELAKTPLVQIRVSATTLDYFYISPKAISTTITIYYLNVGVFQNPNFKNFPNDGYWCRRSPQGTHPKIYLVTLKNNLSSDTKVKDLIWLTNTRDYQEGQPISDVLDNITDLAQLMRVYDKTKWGNPFHKSYTLKTRKVYFYPQTLQETLQHLITEKDKKLDHTLLTETHILDTMRYNPLDDQGPDNKIYLKPTTVENETLDPPEDIDLYSANLPLWILNYGFTDFQKRMGRQKHIDNEYLLVLQTKYSFPTLRTLIIVDSDFINGRSPYESKLNPIDQTQWYPCYQMQHQTSNIIAYSGPGSPKLPPLEACQAKISYVFYFKWGGNPPPMDKITDPKNQPYFHLPSNYAQPNSLQNPTTNPQQYLYDFDQRRDEITKTALKRLQKDFKFTESSFSPAERFQPAIQTAQESSSEESSEEETEETSKLLNKLHKQQRKHQQLKLRIMETLGYLQKLE